MKKPKRKSVDSDKNSSHKRAKAGLSFDHKYILAPMVGASEPAFRILCRNYGADVAFSPMLDVNQFISDQQFRNQCFPECDSPVVAHFGCNNPALFAKAAQLCEEIGHVVVMVDLNLGCPQRTAYLGHYGSYLLDEPDLICKMVVAARNASTIPISVKIRLLQTLEATVDFCRQLCATKAVSLITIHARHRASWERKGPGARDGPAHLDQVRMIKDALKDEYPHVKIVTNGNTISWEDVVSNLHSTHADGLMSAEGILDRPNLFVRRYDNPQETVTISVLPKKFQKQLDKLWKLAQKSAQNKKASSSKQSKYETKLDKLLPVTVEAKRTTAGELQMADAIRLSMQYLDLATAFPVKLRTAIFHTRRILKQELTQYQLLEETLNAENVHEIRIIVARVAYYQQHPKAFAYDSEKALAEKLALERKKAAEGRRKQYEERMIRKAKREKKPLDYYLKIGSEVPTPQLVLKLKTMNRETAMELWQQSHRQHCLTYHLDGACARERVCAFLHVPLHGFEERDEVAG